MFALRPWVPSAALGLLTASVLASADGKKEAPAAPARPARHVARAPLVGRVPPELVADKGDWLGGPPATLAGLRGNVVWRQFNF
jgi:hypothetical protein